MVQLIELGLSREEVKRAWRKCHNEGLHDLSSSRNNLWVITLGGGARDTYGEGGCVKRIACTFFVRNPEERMPLERFWRRLEDNIKITVKDTGYEGVDWIHLV
jgi:hypothetical protein